jgi:hypothetical protein
MRLLALGQLPLDSGQVVVEASLDAILLGFFLCILKLIVNANLLGGGCKAPHTHEVEGLLLLKLHDSQVESLLGQHYIL